MLTPRMSKVKAGTDGNMKMCGMVAGDRYTSKMHDGESDESKSGMSPKGGDEYAEELSEHHSPGKGHGMKKSMKLGGGGRFQKMKAALTGKVRVPGAVAAAIGRKKYGAAKMAKWSAAGSRRAAKAPAGGIGKMKM